jgi:hypothetical protein
MVGDYARVSILLGALGLILCFFLPHIEGSANMLAHVAAAILVVVALGINMSGEAKRQRPRQR